MAGAAPWTTSASRASEPRLDRCEAREAEHRRLLVGLAAAADHGDGRTGLERLQDLRRLEHGRRCERLVVPGIVHAGEHEVLPDEDAQLVAEIVKTIGLVGKRAADANHVHPGFAQLCEGRAIRGRMGGEGCEVQWRPAGTSAEHRNAIDDEAEALAIGVTSDVDGAEPHAAEIDGFRIVAGQNESRVVERLCPMRMRPPAVWRRHAQFRSNDALVFGEAFDDHRSLQCPDGQPPRGGNAGRTRGTERHAHEAGAGRVAIKLGANVGLLDSESRALDRDRPPRTHRGYWRAPGRDPAERATSGTSEAPGARPDCCAISVVVASRRATGQAREISGRARCLPGGVARRPPRARRTCSPSAGCNGRSARRRRQWRDLRIEGVRPRSDRARRSGSGTTSRRRRNLEDARDPTGVPRGAPRRRARGPRTPANPGAGRPGHRARSRALVRARRSPRCRPTAGRLVPREFARAPWIVSMPAPGGRIVPRDA